MTQLHFVVAESHRKRLITVQWKGDWPPPAKLFLLTGRTLGMTAMITEEEITTLRADAPDFDDIFEAREMIKVSQSILDENSAMDFVAPSARYVPPDEVEARWWE